MAEYHAQLIVLPELLLPWYQVAARDLPWRHDRDPYHVWLSEIMLQQTRVEAVRQYYIRFLDALPSIADLAYVNEEHLYKLWEGLGYYTRVRNLQKAAQMIMTEHDGQFPTAYDQIHALPGIGDYTAGAVASICFEQPTPAVDGNVLRVISRVTASDAPIDLGKTKRTMTEALAAVYPKGHCGAFTQALMELGATVCVPNGMPHCENCPLSGICLAHAQGLEITLPVKAKKKARRQEQKTVFLFHCEERWAIEKRPKHGLLAGLWQFPNVEGMLTPEVALHLASEWGVEPIELERQLSRTHIFTHVEWHMTAYYIACRAMPSRFVWESETQFTEHIALPTAFRIVAPFQADNSN
ncbi:MAG: A/G-specific adenine glycosylase [Oscillospiraceae bacterium]